MKEVYRTIVAYKESKRVFYSEAAYVFGIISLAFGTAFMTRANFGLSMVVAPAYLLHIKISQYIPIFSFGMAEYTFQAILLIVLCIALRKFKPMYLFSFVTAIFYGFTLDIAMLLVDTLPAMGLMGRISYFLVGMPLCSLGVALIFHTYIAPEVYELFVKEISTKFHFDINITKTGYDCISCFVAILLSFTFFGVGKFEGIGIGTIICTFANGFLIGKCGKLLDSLFDFYDAMPLRKRFET